MGIRSEFSRFFPPPPTFTETNVLSLAGKIFIVTGGNAGVGLELVKILYSKGGTVYIACRSQSKAEAAISLIKSLPTPVPGGKLVHLPLDLSDLNSVKSAAQAFIAQASRLDTLYNNAAVSLPPIGSVSAQGHELHMGTNCLGPFLLTTLLLPLITRTAKLDSTRPASVRIVWMASGITEYAACPPGGICLSELSPSAASTDQPRNYAMSKAGNWFLASELDKRVREAGIVSIAANPGNLRTTIWDNAPWYIQIGVKIVLHDAKFGAYTELWAGMSEEVGLEDGGRYAVPWGKWHPGPREDLLLSLKSEKEGGTGVAEKFWKWCERECKEFL